MSDIFIIVLLLFQLFHHGFAGAGMGSKAKNAMTEQHSEVTDAMWKTHTEALRLQKSAYPQQRMTWDDNQQHEVDNLYTILSGLSCHHRKDARVVVPLIIQHIMKPVDSSFPSVDVKLPTVEMSLAELEFHWEILEFTAWLLGKRSVPSPAWDSIIIYQKEYWEELHKRVHDAMFGPSPEIEYSSDETVYWTSIIIVFMSQIVRGAKALHFLQHSSYSPVSSITECEFLLSDLRIYTPAANLFWSFFECPEHLLYRELYSHMVAQRGEFIKLACSRFLEEHRKLGCPPYPLLIRTLEEDIGLMKESPNRMVTFSVQGHLQHVTSEIVNLKEQMGKKDYQWDHDTVARISKIMAATPPPLAFVPQGLPFEITPLFEQLPRPENVHLQETSPYLAFAEEYHLLLLWRCMQELSLLQWFKNRFDAKLTPENPGFTSEQVNGAITEMTDKAEYILRAFDAYEKVAGGLHGQSHTSRLSDVERQEFLGIIGGICLTSTWKDILEKKVNEYIMYVERALKNVKVWS
ncbi:hypothetical protein SeLEV6574_g05045 [Synchytrium endobioticum]|uniref:Uncharacterized protein n=1 Tax=Synchytrium endobioticum TaxID=286115 RepID=A0A507CWE5_9FUNG|nr:hypothetical protein SeLEV6574_g08179 [Synchytrium endobioticum]TPX43484.1 hypothetical protein SeLEV6574_g05045 [Synchytrium endobioticum]